MTTLQTRTIEEFRGGFKGAIVLPRDAGYESARSIWNAMIDKRPALIARCATTSDVVRAVNFARDNGLVLAVRGGGHNIAGSAVCDDGIVIDLSQMKAATVDPLSAASPSKAVPRSQTSTPQRRLTVSRYAGRHQLDDRHRRTDARRRLRLAQSQVRHDVDNLESAEVVTADGEVVRASATEHPDLFWGLRGGGGNFGVVTQFRIPAPPCRPARAERTHRVPDLAGKVGAAAVPRIHRQGAGRALRVDRSAPGAAAAVPARKCPWQGNDRARASLCGRPEAGRARSSSRCASSARPWANTSGVQPYVAWQQAFDPLLAPGARNYWKSHNFSTLKDGLFDAVIEYIGKLPSPQCEIFFGAIGGATARPAPDSAAYGHRDAQVRHERPRSLGKCGRRQARHQLGARFLPSRRHRLPAAAFTSTS